MATQVNDCIAKCEKCKTCKPCHQVLTPPMGGQTITERPFQWIYKDFLGPYIRSHAGNNYMLIVIDHMSKFVFLKPMRNANSKNTIKFLISEVFHKFGVLRQCVTIQQHKVQKHS